MKKIKSQEMMMKMVMVMIEIRELEGTRKNKMMMRKKKRERERMKMLIRLKKTMEILMKEEKKELTIIMKRLYCLTQMTRSLRGSHLKMTMTRLTKQLRDPKLTSLSLHKREQFCTPHRIS
jgi:hypothetical protein